MNTVFPLMEASFDIFNEVSLLPKKIMTNSYFAKYKPNKKNYDQLIDCCNFANVLPQEQSLLSCCYVAFNLVKGIDHVLVLIGLCFADLIKQFYF